MKIVFVSNYLNHHQLYLCNELLTRCSSFYFISTDSNRTQGFQKSICAPFIIYYDNPFQKQKCIDALMNADVCIFGACPNELIKKRMKLNKVSFLYTERFLKKGMWRRFIPTTYLKIYNRALKYKNKNFYILCSGSYVVKDLNALHFPTNKCFKWGYYPENIEYQDLDTLISSKRKNSILWCGRFLDWKHPEHALLLGKELKSKGLPYNLKIIGNGPLRDYLEKQIDNYNLGECIQLVDALSPSDIRKEMEASSIFIFTSDYYEGWGAVLNESMNSGCAVVSSSAIGSSDYLIQNGINGFIYDFNKIDDFFKKVIYLLEKPEECITFGKNAVETINTTWNAKVAAERLIELSKAAVGGVMLDELFVDGPCSLSIKKD